MAVAAKAAGASPETLATLADEAAEAKQLAADSRPLGARLDSARAKVKRAQAKVVTAEAALEHARETLAETQQAAERAEQELKALEAELEGTSPAQELAGVVDSAHALLQRLENSRLAIPLQEGSSQPVLECMRQLREALEAASPLRLDGGIGAEGTSEAAAERVEPKAPERAVAATTPAPAAHREATDETNWPAFLKRLSEEENDTELAAQVRQRLRSNPY